MIKTVFLDVDGVLADFNKLICEKIGAEYPPTKWFYNEGFCSFDEMDKLCDFDFWVNVSWMPDGNEILKLIRSKFSLRNIYLLTTPMPNVQSPSGRWAWIKKYLPDFYWQTILCPAPKKLLAKPNTLLIDDKTKNVDEFRQAGGQTILVPRPWNSLHLLADKSVEIVKQQLAEIK